MKLASFSNQVEVVYFMKKCIFINLEDNMKNFVNLWVFDLGLSRKLIFILFRKANKLIGRPSLYKLSSITTLTVRP